MQAAPPAGAGLPLPCFSHRQATAGIFYISSPTGLSSAPAPRTIISLYLDRLPYSDRSSSSSFLRRKRRPTAGDANRRVSGLASSLVPSPAGMAKQSCCHKKKLRRGLWSPEEDEKLMNHIAKYGHGCWSSVPKLAGLERCGKSCRLRWINYLRPDLKRGTFSQEEEDLIIHLHSLLGNKWSQIAAQLPGRTDNEVKNFWNSYIKKRLRERGIDPATHQPLADSGAAAATSACRAVFGNVDLIPTTTPLQAPLAEPMLDWPVAGSAVPPSSLSRSSCYLQGGCFDMDALQQHCGTIPAPVVVPSASSSSTLTSMAEAEHCNTSVAAGANLPWLELGPNAAVADAGHVDSYAGALDELRWSEYFDGAFQAAASQQGALQAGQCVYSGKDDVPVHFDVHGGLSNWC